MKVNNKTDFVKTLNLPKQVIAIKGNQVKKEEYILNKIQDVKKSQYVLNKNLKGNKKRYRIIEMPTDIDNSLSSTIILNKILKDFVIKDKMMRGNYIKHNLFFTNVESMEQIDSLPNNKNNIQELLKTRQQKRKELGNMFKGQIIEINNLGTTFNYDRNILTTIKNDFEIDMIEKFYEMYKQDRLKKETTTTHWCPKCATTKRRKNIIYKKREVDNYYVLYRVEDDRGKLSRYKNLENTYFIASTYMPWLMVSSQNIAISNELEYSLVEVVNNGKNLHYIIASDYVQDIMQKEFYTKYEVKQTFKADDLKEIQCMNPLDYRKRVNIILTDKDKVTYNKDDSTGVRIVSSGHTYLDYLILKNSKKEELKSVVDEYGKTNNLSLVFQNMDYKEVNSKIIEYLKESKFIYTISKIKVSIPTCDVCMEDTIYRVSNDWFVIKHNDDVITGDTISALEKKIKSSIKYKKEELISSIEKINKARQSHISDKNILGTPIPVFYCADCGENIISEKTIEILSNMIKSKGSDAWYKQTPEEILQGQVVCRNCGCTFFFKENATLNNFFKYICINLMQQDEETKDSDETNIMIESKEEFIDNLKAISYIQNANDKINSIDNILVHSNVVNKIKDNEETELPVKKNSKKERKSLFFKNKKRNTNIKIETKITDIIHNYGTDILRLWAAYFSDKERITLNNQTLININKKYKNIRRVFKYILSNLYDFHPGKNYINIEDRIDIDKYVYNELYNVTNSVKVAYDRLDFSSIYKILTKFGENTLCKLYFESIKYKLYILSPDDKKRRSIQSTMYDIIISLCELWYAIIPFTIEEIWPYIYHKSAEEDRIIYTSNIVIKDIHESENEAINKWKKIFGVKEKLDIKIKLAQKKKLVKHTSEIKIILNTNSYTKKFVEDNYDDIVESVYVSSIEANVSDDHDVKIQKEPGTQCVRCLRYTNEIGKNLKYRYLCPKCAEILEEQTQNK